MIDLICLFIALIIISLLCSFWAFTNKKVKKDIKEDVNEKDIDFNNFDSTFWN